VIVNSPADVPGLIVPALVIAASTVPSPVIVPVPEFASEPVVMYKEAVLPDTLLPSSIRPLLVNPFAKVTPTFIPVVTAITAIREVLWVASAPLKKLLFQLMTI